MAEETRYDYISSLVVQIDNGELEETDAIELIDKWDTNNPPPSEDVVSETTEVIDEDGEEIVEKTVVKEGDPEKEKRKKQILRKLNTGFDVSIEDAQFLHDEFGYDYYQPDIDDFDANQMDNIQKISDINNSAFRDITEGETEMRQEFDPATGKVKEVPFTKLSDSQRSYLTELSDAGFDESKVINNKDLEILRNKITQGLNKDNWGLNASNEEYGNAKRPNVQIYKNGEFIGAKGERKNLEMLQEAVLWDNPFSEYEFKNKWGMSIPEALGIPKQVMDEWHENWDNVRSPVTGGITGPTRDSYNELVASYQNNSEFNMIRELTNEFRGDELRKRNLDNRSNDYRGAKTSPFGDLSTGLGLKGEYQSSEEFGEFVYSDGKYNTLLDQVIQEQTADVLNVVKDYMPTKSLDARVYEGGQGDITFDFDYAMDMRNKMSNTTDPVKLKNLKNEWINYIKDFEPSAIDENTELLINPKTKQLYTREEVENGEDAGGKKIVETELVTEQDFINANYRQTDLATLEQNMVDKAFQIVAAAEQIANPKANAQLNEIKGLTDIFRNAFGGVSNYEDVLELAKNGEMFESVEEIPPRYEKMMPGVYNYNQMVRELKVLSKAYYTNINPLTFEQDATMDGFGDRFTEYVGISNMSPDEQKVVFAEMFQKDFPEIYSKFSKKQVDEFYETSQWRNFGVGVFDFGIIALEFAATRKISMGTINRVVNGFSKLNRATGVWEGSGGLRGALTTALGPNTGFAGRGFIDASCLFGEEFLAIEGRNILTSFAPYETDRMNPLFATGLTPFKLFNQNFRRFKANPKLVSGTKLEGPIKSYNNMVYKINKSGIPTATAENVATWTTGFGLGVTSLQTGTMVEHGFINPGYDYLSGNITFGEAKDQFSQALHHFTDAEGWASMTGQMLAVGGFRPRATFIKARENLSKDINTVFDPKNKKYINNYAKNLGTDYEYVFKDEASSIQKSRIKKKTNEELKEKGIVDQNGDVDVNTYENINAAFKELGGFEILDNSGSLKDLKTFEEALSTLENPTERQQLAISTIKRMIQQEAGQGAMFGLDNVNLSKFRQHYKIAESSKVLNNIVDLRNTQRLLENTQEGFDNLVNFNTEAKKLNPLALETPDVIEFMGNNSEGSITELLKEAGWDDNMVSNVGPFIKAAKEINAVASNEGLQINTQQRKDWVQSQIDLYDLNQGKIQLENQLKEVNTISAKRSIEKAIEVQDEKIQKAEEKGELALDEALAFQNTERERLTELAQQEAGEYLETYEDTKAFDNRIEELYKEDKIDKIAYTELINKKRFNEDQYNEFIELDKRINELQESNPDSPEIKSLEERQLELLEAATDIAVKGAHVTVDGRKINLLDKEVMKNLQSYTDAQHENLHHYFNDQFRKLNILDNEPKKREFIQEFKNLLPENIKEIVERKLSKSKAYKDDPNTIEWLNVFAESLIRGDLNYTLGDVKQLATHLESYLGKETEAKEMTFTPKEALEFIYEYAADTRGNTVNDKVSKVIAGQEDVALDDKLVADLSEVSKDLTNKKKQLIADFGKVREGLDQKDPDFKKKFLEKNGISYAEYLADYQLRMEMLNKSIGNIGIKTNEEGEEIGYSDKYLGLRAKNQENADIITNPKSSAAAIEQAKIDILRDNEKGTLQFYYDKYIPDRAMSFADFKQEIYLKAWKALGTYDPSKGTTIHTHLRSHLKYAVGDAVIALKEKGHDKHVGYEEESQLDWMQKEYGGGEGIKDTPVNPEAASQIAATRMLKEEFNISPEAEVEFKTTIAEALDKMDIKVKKDKPVINFKDISKATREDISKIIQENIPGTKTFDNPPKGENKILRDNYLKDHFAELYSLMPENLNAWGDATGVANSLLKNFYEVGDRVSQVESGTGKGTKKQVKKKLDFNSPLAKREWLEAFEGRNGNTLFTALMRSQGDVLANQYVREYISTPEGQRVIADKLGEEYVSQFKEEQFVNNLLWGIKSGMSESTLGGKVLFSEVEKGFMDELQNKAKDLNITMDEMNEAIVNIRAGNYNVVDPLVREQVNDWLDHIMMETQNKEASSKFTTRAKKEFDDKLIRKFSEDNELTFDEGKEVFELFSGKGSMISKSKGIDAERMKYFTDGQKEFTNEILAAFPGLLNLKGNKELGIKGKNKGSLVLEHLFGIAKRVSGDSGKNTEWFNPESFRGKEAKEVEWLSQETKDYLKDIKWDKINIQNIDAMQKYKTALMGTDKTAPLTDRQKKIDYIRELMDVETQENLTKLYKFIQSAKIDYYEGKQGKGLEEIKKASTFLYQLEQGNTQMVYGTRGLYFGKYFHITEGSQGFDMKNPIYKEYYDEGLSKFEDYGPNAKVKYGKSEYINKFEFAKSWARKNARIKGEHLFASSNRSFESLKDMFSGVGRRKLEHLNFDEKIQVFMADGYLKKIDKFYGPTSTYGKTRFIQEDLLPQLENIIDPLTGKSLAHAIREDAAVKVTNMFKGTEYEKVFTTKILNDPLTRDAFDLVAVDPTKANLDALKNNIENLSIAQKQQDTRIDEVEENISNVGIEDDFKNVDLKDLSPVQLQALNQQLIKVREAQTNVDNIKEGNHFEVFDGDEVLWTFPKESEQKIKYTLPDGTTGELTNTEFNARQKELEDKGAEFNFDVFNTMDGAIHGPGFDAAVEAWKKAPDDFFISTARGPGARKAIIKWMNENGFEGFAEKNLDTVQGTFDAGGESLKVQKTLFGLADGSRNGKVYTSGNYYDDHHDNVTHWGHGQEALDIKGAVNLVVSTEPKLQFSEEAAREEGILYNQSEPGEALSLIIQERTGIPTTHEYKAAKAKLRGKGKKTWNLIPPNAQDFMGLLYPTLARGKKGEAQLDYYKKVLGETYSSGERSVERQTTRISNEYNELLKSNKGITSKLNSKPPEFDGYTLEQAIRIYAWDMQGKDIEGLSKKDLNSIRNYMNNNPEAMNFSQKVLGLSNLGVYEGGSTMDLLAGSIWGDLAKTVDIHVRENELAGFNANIDAMFTDNNLRKLEASYGTKYRDALENMIFSMKSGKNRAYDLGPIDTKAYNFVNNANGALMALNFRSATLQLTSTFNYINWGDNNMAKAGLAFANQPQFWKDFSYLWNSQSARRGGNQQNIAEAEIAEYLKGKKNQGQALISYLINKGYAPTKYADSFAIAFGGASFYRNRINSLMKKNPELSKEEAEDQAFLDFSDETETHQQSRRPDKTSLIQRTLKGRIMLGFHTTQMQYTRLIDKSIQDLVKQRGNPVENISKIINYAAIQPALFHGMQLGAFMMLFQDESEEGKQEKLKEVLEGGAGSIVEGTGTFGVVANTLYKATSTYLEEKEKEFTKDGKRAYPGPQYYKAALKLLDLSPSLGGKVKMGMSAMYDQMYKDPKKTIKIYHPDNPDAASSVKVIQTLTNLPLKEAWEFYGQMYKVGVQFYGPEAGKMDAVKIAAIALGWPEYQLESYKDKNSKKTKKKKKKKSKYTMPMNVPMGSGPGGGGNKYPVAPY